MTIVLPPDPSGVRPDASVAPDMAADMSMPPDLAHDMTLPPDLTPPCGGFGEPCCGGPTPCDQAKANFVGQFGTVCTAGICAGCGRNDGASFLCCEAPNQCVPGQHCALLVEGYRCTG